MGMLYLQEIAMLSHGPHNSITKWSLFGYATKSPDTVSLSCSWNFRTPQSMNLFLLWWWASMMIL